MQGGRDDLLEIMKSYSSTDTMNAVFNLIRYDLDDARKKNDSATGVELFRNQGTILYLKKLLKELISPPKNKEHIKARKFDGGFGE